MARVTIVQLEGQIKELTVEIESLRQSCSYLSAENERLKKELSEQIELNKRNAGRKRTIKDDQLAEIRELYKQGKSYNDIGKIYGVSGTAIRARLKEKQSECETI